MDQAQQIENIKKAAFGEQFDKDIAEFRQKLADLFADMGKRGYYAAYHYTNNDGVNLVMLPKIIEMGARSDTREHPDAVNTNSLLDAVADTVALVKDGEPLYALYLQSGCVDEKCWVNPEKK
jgi:hypothetical protein